jgi:hypothetical protein
MSHIHREQVTLSAAQINGLDSNQPTIVPPQTSGALILPISVFAIPKTFSNYTGSGSFKLFVGSHELATGTDAVPDLNANKLMWIINGVGYYFLNSVAIEDFLGQGIRLGVSAHIGGGSGQVDFVTTYQIVYPSL